MRLHVNDRDAYRAINTIALRARIKNRFVSERLAHIYSTERFPGRFGPPRCCSHA